MSLPRLLWAVAVALAIVVAGAAYLERSNGEPRTRVLVAKQLIPAGTLVSPRMFDLRTARRDEVEVGTIADIRYIALRCVTHPISPGERFRVSDFSTTTNSNCR